jgi:hypothetical protein
MSSNLPILYDSVTIKLDEAYSEIKQLKTQNVIYENKIKDLEDKINDLESDKEYYNFLYHKDDDEDTEDTETECETETEIEIVSSDIRKELESDLEKEDRLIELGLEINRLQFEISEHFHQIKKELLDGDYERYKIEKRNFYKMIDVLYNIYQGKDKFEIFNILITILSKQKKVFEYDHEISTIN